MIIGMLFVLVIIALSMSVPVVSMLIKHQQTMATILRGSPQSTQVTEELSAIRYEIAQLSAAVSSLRAALPSPSQQSDKDLSSRFGGVGR